VAVADEATARTLEVYFKSGSGKAFAKTRFLPAAYRSLGELTAGPHGSRR